MNYSISIFLFSVLLLFFISSWWRDNISCENPIEFPELKNDLKVFLSLDRTASLFVVAVHYSIGCCIEPKDGANFAPIIYLFNYKNYSCEGTEKVVMYFFKALKKYIVQTGGINFEICVEHNLSWISIKVNIFKLNL